MTAVEDCGGLFGVACALYEQEQTTGVATIYDPTPAQVAAMSRHPGTPLGFYLLGSLVAVALVLAVMGPWLRRREPRLWWLLGGYLVAAVRVRWSWRRFTELQDLAVAKRPAIGVVGQVVVRGKGLRLITPRVGIARFRRGGMVVRVRMHPGQTPEQYQAAGLALAHAWRVFSVRVTSVNRGYVELTASAWDPLSTPTVPRQLLVQLLSAAVGVWENGAGWVVDLREVPHWLIVGATRSGKSTLIAALVSAWAPQRVALVGIDLKGGMELSLFEARLSALATTRAQAADLLSQLVEMAHDRMELCRSLGARSIWDLPEKGRPVPVIVIVDEVAELYLMATSADRAEVGQVSTSLLRLGQLGAALGIHLVVAGQRVGSDLGIGVTALRAQLAGRVCHRVADKGTAEMALGDLNPDALVTAQAITSAERGVAVTVTSDGEWMRARSVLVSPAQAQRTAERYRHLAPVFTALGWAGGPPGAGTDELRSDEGWQE